MAEKDSRTRAQRNRAVRQDALRDQLKEQGHIQHVIDCISKIQDVTIELDVLSYQRLKTAAELRLKLVNKYLADLKSVEVTGNFEVNHVDKPLNEMTIEELEQISASGGNVHAIR